MLRGSAHVFFTGKPQRVDPQHTVCGSGVLYLFMRVLDLVCRSVSFEKYYPT